MFYRKEMNFKMKENKKKYSARIFAVKRKNILGLIGVVMIMSAVISGCAKSEKTFDEEKFINEIKPNIECLQSCVQEIFGADISFDKRSYLSAYESEEAYDDGRGERVVLFLPEEEEKYAKDYYIDPTYSDFYVVNNFKTNDEVRENLRKYMSDEIIDNYFRDDFFEYDGMLYLVRGARGYGAIDVDCESVKYVGEKDGKQYVSVDILYFDEYDYTETVEFSRIDDRWIITEEIKE